jgi:hypothetical protein
MLAPLGGAYTRRVRYLIAKSSNHLKAMIHVTPISPLQTLIGQCPVLELDYTSTLSTTAFAFPQITSHSMTAAPPATSPAIPTRAQTKLPRLASSIERPAAALLLDAAAPLAPDADAVLLEAGEEDAGRGVNTPPAGSWARQDCAAVWASWAVLGPRRSGPSRHPFSEPTHDLRSVWRFQRSHSWTPRD